MHVFVKMTLWDAKFGDCLMWNLYRCFMLKPILSQFHLCSTFIPTCCVNRTEAKWRNITSMFNLERYLPRQLAGLAALQTSLDLGHSRLSEPCCCTLRPRGAFTWNEANVSLLLKPGQSLHPTKDEQACLSCKCRDATNTSSYQESETSTAVFVSLQKSCWNVIIFSFSFVVFFPFLAFIQRSE